MDSEHKEGNASSAFASTPGLEKDAGRDKDEEELATSNIFRDNPLEMPAGGSVFEDGVVTSDSPGDEPEPPEETPVETKPPTPTEASEEVAAAVAEVPAPPSPYEPQPGSSVFDNPLEQNDGQESESTSDPDAELPQEEMPQTTGADEPPAVDAGDDKARRPWKRWFYSLLVLALLAGVAYVVWDQFFNDEADDQPTPTPAASVVERVSTLCQTDGINLEEADVFWFGQSLEYNRIDSFWPGDQVSHDSASAVVRQAVTELYESVGDGCTAAGVAYWRNILPQSIDADRPGVDNHDAATRIAVYSEEPATRVAVAEETARRLNSCAAEAQFVELTAAETPRIYAAAYTQDYSDVVFVETPLLQIDDLPSGDKGLSVIRCTFGKTEGSNGAHVNDVLISPSLRAIVYLDRPTGRQVFSIMPEDEQPTPAETEQPTVDQTEGAADAAPEPDPTEPVETSEEVAAEVVQEAAQQEDVTPEVTDEATEAVDAQASGQPAEEQEAATEPTQSATKETSSATTETATPATEVPEAEDTATTAKSTVSDPEPEEAEATKTSETQVSEPEEPTATEEKTSTSTTETEVCPEGGCDPSGTTPKADDPASGTTGTTGTAGKGQQGSDPGCGNSCGETGEDDGAGQKPGDGPGQGGDGQCTGTCPGDGDGDEGDGDGQCQGKDCPGDEPEPDPEPEGCPPGWLIDPFGNCKAPDPGTEGF